MSHKKFVPQFNGHCASPIWCAHLGHMGAVDTRIKTHVKKCSSNIITLSQRIKNTD